MRTRKWAGGRNVKKQDKKGGEKSGGEGKSNFPAAKKDWGNGKKWMECENVLV